MKKILWFFILFFVYGIFIGSYEVSVITYYSRFNSGYELPLVIFATAFTMVFFALFFKGLGYISSKVSSTLFLILLLVITVFLTFGQKFSFSDKMLSFAGLAFLIPFSFISLDSFRKDQIGYFTNEQKKRINWILELGLVSGIVFINLIVLALLFFYFKTKDIFYFSLVGIFLTIVILFIIESKYKPVANEFSGTVAFNESKLRLRYLLKHKLFRNFIFFALISTITLISVQFLFISVVFNTYEGPNGIGKFICLVNTSLFIFYFFFRFVLIRRILNYHGTPYNLILSPFLLLAIVLLTIIIVPLAGYNKVVSHFTFLFITLTIVKILNYTLFQSIEKPSMQIMSKLIDKNFLSRLWAFFDTFLLPIGVGVFGGVMMIAVKLFSIRIYNYTIILFAIILLWTITTFILLKTFRVEVKEFLIKVIKKDKTRRIDPDPDYITELKNIQNTNLETDLILYLLSLSYYTHPDHYRQAIYNLLNSKEERIKEIALNIVEKDHLFEYHKTIQKAFESERSIKIKDRLNIVDNTFEDILNKHKTFDDIQSLAISNSTENRILAAALIGYYKEIEFSPLLTVLMNDHEPGVKIVALKAAYNYSEEELVPHLLKYIDIPILCTFAFDALKRNAPKNIQLIEDCFYNADTSESSLLQIIRLYNQIGDNSAVISLVEKLNHQDTEVVYRAIQALINLNYKPDENSLTRILNSIVKLLSIITWNLNILNIISADFEKSHLMDAVETEIKENLDHLYLLLAITYNKNVIEIVKKLITQDDESGNDFAIELLDNIIEDNIKPGLYPVFENTSGTTKMKHLQYYFVTEGLTKTEAVLSVLSREYNMIGYWTKACALNYIIHHPDFKVTEEIIANIFHPDELIFESAALAIYSKDSSMVISYLSRLEPVVADKIMNAINKFDSLPEDLFFEKVLYLKNHKLFKHLRVNTLIEICKYFETVVLAENQEITYSEKLDRLPLYFINTGELEIVSEWKVLYKVTDGSIVDFMFFTQLVSPNLKIRTKKRTVIYMLPKDLFKLLIFNSDEFTDIMFTNYKAYIEELQNQNNHHSKK